MSTVEQARLADAANRGSWRRWGPYLSERAWATVREDYSPNGDAWHYLSHDQARSKAYRWGEDGLAGISDRDQRLCLALAVWNGRDPILKERLFGLVPSEGNHSEDVKECYYYLDNLPSHAYMRLLYKYPQAAFPYAALLAENRRRGARDPEYELIDTGVFDGDRYFDVFVEYAKAGPDDVVMRVEAFNRGPEPATLHLLPTLWFRNTWAWRPGSPTAPTIALGGDAAHLVADDRHRLYAEAGGRPLFTDNETNAERVYGPGHVSRSRYTKDAFHRFVVDGEEAVVNPALVGTKAGIWYTGEVPAGGSTVVRLRLTDRPVSGAITEVDAILDARRAEADEFYAAVHPPRATDDERLVQRQAFAGLLWSKQLYIFDVSRWLDGDDPACPPPSRATPRNRHWRHMDAAHVLSMPDTWEYPWFAAWDLAFHTIPLALVDPEFAKEQLWLLLTEDFQHPNGQLPAYEWEFSDTNPPVHGWAVWRVYNMDRIRSGRADRDFLERCFHKLLINFAWWINKVDREGNNVFEGGFLGLDNIAFVDRSERLPDGAHVEQADASGWMGMFCLNMMRIALELAKENRSYEALAVKFFQHYVYIGAAMEHMGGRELQLWDDADGFFHDVLHYADGGLERLPVRSMVGLIPLFAVERLERDWLEQFPLFRASLDLFLTRKRHVTEHCITTVEHGGRTVHVLALPDHRQLRQIVARLWNADEFLSPYGLRSLSKAHAARPFVHGPYVLGYEPAEAATKIKGGNSNWRGPVWFPTAFLMIESLRKLAKAYGDDLDLGLIDDRGQPVDFARLTREHAERLMAIFTRDADGRRPAHGACDRYRADPHWRDLVLFYEYFHADTGAGLGASHQTGWTGLVAALIDEWRR